MLIDTVSRFNEVKHDLLSCFTPTVDTETDGLNPWGTASTNPNVIIGIAVKTHTQAYYFPFRHLEGNNLPIECMEFFRSYLSNPSRVYRGFNYKFDMHMLWRDGVPYAPTIEDAMLALHLLNENEPNFRLKDTCDRYGIGDGSLQESVLRDKVIAECQRRNVPISLSKSSPDNWKSKMWLLPASEIEPYACDDVILTEQLIQLMEPALREYNLYQIWQELNYYSVITTEMENRGLLLDTDLIHQYANEAEGHYKTAVEELEKAAGKKVNPNSSKQCCALLGTKSSAAEILDVLSEREDDIGDISRRLSEARGWSSVNSRYYTPYLESCDKENILRTSLNLIGTISGRLSSSNPNLQAVARQTDVFKVKDVFKAREGYTLISADYSQAEMRLASYYAKETTMIDFIINGADIHSVTAEALGIPRDAAKRINFGVIYGIGKDALSEQLHISKTQAQEYLKKYHSMYPQFRKLYRACEHVAERDGFIRMWTGRMRHYNAQNPTHKAMSNLIQGGVAEIMRVSISKLYPYMHDLEGYMLLQVHDQIIFEIPDSNVDVAISIIREVMQDFEFYPPMLVDIKYGKTWGGMKKWQN